MDNLVTRAAKDLAAANHVVALTGAGISVESGIPPFRGKGGVWEKIDPMEYAHIDAFMNDPVKVWNVLLKDMKLLLEEAEPHAAHMVLGELEKRGSLKTIITQNVDGLHQRAGNTDVIEFHGTFAQYKCLACEQQVDSAGIDIREIPPRCACGGIWRPEVVFFGEMIPPQHLWRSKLAATECDLMLVIGTSAVVQPAAFMPVIAKESGAKVIEVNPEPTPLTGSISNYLILGKAGEVMQAILDAMP